MTAEDADQLVTDNLDHLLGGRQCGEHLLVHGLFPDVADELLDHAKVNVGLQPRHADLTQGRLHVLGREFPLATQVLEDALQLIA